MICNSFPLSNALIGYAIYLSIFFFISLLPAAGESRDGTQVDHQGEAGLNLSVVCQW